MSVRPLWLTAMFVCACQGVASLDDAPAAATDASTDTASTDSDPGDDPHDTDATDTDVPPPDCLYARVFGVAYVGAGESWTGRIERVVGRDCPTVRTRCHLEWSGTESEVFDPTDLCPTCTFGVTVRWGGRQDVLSYEEGRDSRCGVAFDGLGGTPDTFEQTYLFDDATDVLWRHTPSGPVQYATAVDYADGTLTYRVDLR